MLEDEFYSRCLSMLQTPIQVKVASSDYPTFWKFISSSKPKTITWNFLNPLNMSFSGSIDPNIENISSNVNRAERSQNSTGSGNFNYSSEESNDSLVIDQDN